MGYDYTAVMGCMEFAARCSIKAIKSNDSLT